MLVNRYLLAHFWKNFAGALAVLCGVMLIVQWLKMGTFVGPGDLDVLLLAMVPMALYIIPMAVMFSVLLVLSRLSSETEIVALMSLGYSRARLAVPVLIFAGCCTVLHLTISTWLGPLSTAEVQRRLLERAPEKIHALIPERSFEDTFKGVVLYVESVDPVERELRNIFIETTGEEHSVIVARRGRLAVQGESVSLHLHDGNIFIPAGDSLRSMRFGEYVFGLQANLTRELNISSRDTAGQKGLAQMIARDHQPKDIKEFHDRLAFPALNILMALVGITFGIQRPRAPSSTGFVIGMGTLVAFYMVFVFAGRLMKAGVLNPVIAAWLPVTVFLAGLCVVWLCRVAVRRRLAS